MRSACAVQAATAEAILLVANSGLEVPAGPGTELQDRHQATVAV
jgi:hypothetical protein